jgi:hypothetical protein
MSLLLLSNRSELRLTSGHVENTERAALPAHASQRARVDDPDGPHLLIASAVRVAVEDVSVLPGADDRSQFLLAMPV